MQTHAPSSAVAQAPNVGHVITEHRPRVHQMRPGWMFQQPSDPLRILSLLHHQQVDVSDAQSVWCVVVAAGNGCNCVIGDLVALPRNAVVQRLRVVGAMQLAPL